MGKTVLKYRIRCTTDKKWETIWLDEGVPPPSTCPVNSNHNVKLNSVSIVGRRANEMVIIKEEQIIETGGHYQAQSFELDIPAVVGWYERDITFPIDISLLSSSWINKADYDGDEGQYIVGPDMIIGNLDGDVSVSDEQIKITNSMMDLTDVGYYIKLDDGTNVNDLGRVLGKDNINKKITMENAATDSFSTGTPTYVKQTIMLVPHIAFDVTHAVVLGATKVGASHIPANTMLKLRYHNLTGTAKTFSFILEYLY